MSCVTDASQLAAAPTINVAQLAGPLRDLGADQLQNFDVNLDGAVDSGDDGPKIGIGLDHAQYYTYTIDMINRAGPDRGPGPQVLEVITNLFSLSPIGEDDDDGIIDGTCIDGDCNGIMSAATCPVTTTDEAVRGNEPDRHFMVIDMSLLDKGESCRTTVHIKTDRAGRGNQFLPSSCEILGASTGDFIINTVAVHEGIKSFDMPANGAQRQCLISRNRLRGSQG